MERVIILPKCQAKIPEFPTLPQKRVDTLRKEGSKPDQRAFSPKRKRMDSEGGDSFFSIPEEDNATNVGKGSWAGGASQNLPDNQQRKSWRNKANLLHGTSK